MVDIMLCKSSFMVCSVSIVFSSRDMMSHTLRIYLLLLTFPNRLNGLSSPTILHIIKTHTRKKFEKLDR